MALAESKAKRKHRGDARRKPVAESPHAEPAHKQPKPFEFTNVNKVIYSNPDIVKADVIHFYLRIAEWLLPYLRDRPVTLERLPEGLDHATKPHFWQKNTPDYYPDWIPRVKLPSKQGKLVHYVLVNNAETLAYLVNQGTLTFHVWLSRVQNLDHPDFVLFDLDPGEAGFGAAVSVAKQLHSILKAQRTPSFVKTSGKTGLHILVPWRDSGGYDEARTWALGIAHDVIRALPDTATTERSKATRGRRVYVDVMQNARGLHVVPPYVLRAVSGAPVSTPVDWREMTAKLQPGQYNLKTIFGRLARQKRDPMTGLIAALGTAQK